MTLRWPLTHKCWCPMCDSTQGSLCPTPMVIHQSIWIQWLFFKKRNQKVNDPKMTFDPHFCWGHMTVWFKTRIIYPRSTKKVKVCGYSDPFFKNLNRKSSTHRWPLTPCLSVDVTCVTLPKDHCFQVPWEYINEHLAQKVPRRFLKLAVCEYPTTLNNSEIYILSPKPYSLMWHLVRGNRVRNSRDRRPWNTPNGLTKSCTFENSYRALWNQWWHAWWA